MLHLNSINKHRTIKVIKILNGYLTMPSAVQTAYYKTSQICAWNKGKWILDSKSQSGRSFFRRVYRSSRKQQKFIADSRCLLRDYNNTWLKQIHLRVWYWKPVVSQFRDTGVSLWWRETDWNRVWVPRSRNVREFIHTHKTT